MPQKTLLSFFKVNDCKQSSGENAGTLKTQEDEIRSEDGSPVKAARTHKKRLRISSSESDSDHSTDGLLQENKDIASLTKKQCVRKNLNDETVNSAPSSKAKLDNVKTEFLSNEISDEDKNKKDMSENCKVSIFGQSNSQSDKDSVIKDYNPNISNYDPIRSASWSKGQKVPFYALARTLEEIENVSARLKMIEILSNYFRSVIVLSPNDLLPSIYLCLNRLGPAHEGIELGVAENTLIRSISQSTGRTVTQIRNEIQEIGDLGIVAERSRSSQRLMVRPLPLTVDGMFKKFVQISKMIGAAAINKKITIIQTLYVACKGPEAKFLIRFLNGKLRIGLAEQSLLQSIALACATTPPGQGYPPEILDTRHSKSAESFKTELDKLTLILKTVYCECPNYDLIVPVMLERGIYSLPEHCKITPGLPMKPMLALPTKGVQEVLTRFEGLEFTCEWKYDGERSQIHYMEDGTVKIYSRNQEDLTPKYPDVVSRIDKTRRDGVKSFILDCEAVAWDCENKRILPFQVLRSRKLKDVTNSDIKVPVCLFMFDLLYLNGRPLVKESLQERRRLLRENFNAVDGEWMYTRSIDTSKIDEVQEFLDEAVKGNCEGLMVKTLKEDATYEISKRSRNWLKLKKDYLDGVGDTLDLLVLGGYFGQGKRTGTYGGFLVGCYDDDNDEYQSVCKLGTGFSEEFLASRTEYFKDHVISKAPSYYRYDSSLEPHHWFEAVQVWEIKCADLLLSNIHRAGIGMVDPDKGITLRFPRFLRIRDDKKPEEGTTTHQIIAMYNNQEQVKSQIGKKLKFSDENFY